MDSKKVTLYSMVMLVIFNITIFFPSLFHIAKGDHLFYLIETADFDSFLDLITHSYSYTRTRLLLSGDQIYFRPLFYLSLSLQRYFFKYNFMYWQIVGLGMHLITIGCLLKLLNAIQPNKRMAFVFTLFFSLLYLSADMAIWHHISMYLICFIFILLSLIHLISYVDGNSMARKSLWPIVIYLLLASFANEFGLVACVLIMVVAFAYRPAKLKLNNHPGILVIPIVVYFYLSILDYLLRFSIQDLMGTVTGVNTSLNFLNIVGNFIVVILASLLLPLAPAFFTIFPDDRNRGVFLLGEEFYHFWVLNKTLIIVNSMLLVFVFAVLIFCIVRWRKIFHGFQSYITNRRDAPAATMLLISLLLFIGYILVLIVSRGKDDFFSYLSFGLYHFYPLCLFLTIIGYCLFSIASQTGIFRTNRFNSIILVILCLGTGLNAVRLYELNVRGKNVFKPWGHYVQQVEHFIQEHKHEPDFSFDFKDREYLRRPVQMRIGGLFDGKFVRGYPSDFIFRKYLTKDNPKYYLSYSRARGLILLP